MLWRLVATFTHFAIINLNFTLDVKLLNVRKERQSISGLKDYKIS